MPSANPLLIDINPAVNGESTPRQLVEFNGELFFSAFQPGVGTELWKSDGTVEGTVLVANINPSNVNPISSIPLHLTNVNGTLFFVANDIPHGFELWKSDGTSQGTELVRDITPGSAGNISAIDNLTAVGNRLYFSAGDQFGNELWVSDGTEEGTMRISDIAPGDLNSAIQKLTVVGDNLFFVASNGSSGNELFKLNPLNNQITLVREIYPGSRGGDPADLVNVNGTLFFTADDPDHSRELWRSDGTTEGTVLVRDIRPTTYPSSTYPRTSSPRYLTNFNGMLFFSAAGDAGGNELWESDGTEEGTVMVKEISVGFSSQGPNNFGVVGNTLFFSGEDALAGFELWKTDGTTEGTVLVKDIAQFPFSAFESNPENLRNLNGILYFTANDQVNGSELWRSDGTEAGTVLVRDIAPSGPYGFEYGPAHLTIAANRLFFVVDDGVNGEELWVQRNSPVSVAVLAGQTTIRDISGGSVDIAASFNAGAAEYTFVVRQANVIVDQIAIASSAVASGLQVFLDGGNDRLDLSAVNLVSTVFGGAGNDTLLGSQGVDSLLGGDGLDSLDASGGNDFLTGGAGDDVVAGGGGVDMLVEIQDFSIILSGNSTSGTLRMTLLNGAVQATDALTSIEAASLRGGESHNRIDAGNWISPSITTLVGGGGRDTIIGSPGRDRITTFSSGRDSIQAGNGNDTITTGSGDDTVDGGGGNDAILGQSGNDSLSGGGDDDSLFGADGNDILLGTTGNDQLFGQQDNDLTDGGDGDDSLFGSMGDDTLLGAAGRDLLRGETGTDSMNGGAGSDRVDESVNGNVTVVGMQIQSLVLGTETVALIERFVFIGGNGANLFNARQSSVVVQLTGQAGNDTLIGGSGNDTVRGNDGDDVLTGSGGTDVIDGGLGTDHWFESANASFTVTGLRVVSTASGDETGVDIERIAIEGGAGNNTLNASSTTIPVLLVGGQGNDTLLGGSGNDTLTGGFRGDSTVAGSDGIDSLNGGAGTDTLKNDPSDTLSNTGGDTLQSDVFALLPTWLDLI